MALQRSSTDALVSAIQQTAEALGEKIKYAIAVHPKGESHDVVLVDASSGDPRSIKEIERVEGVSDFDLTSRMGQLLRELPKKPGLLVPIFRNESHEGHQSRCWKLIDMTTKNPEVIGGKQIVVAYAPVIC